jgi:hypothetical protein
MKTKEWAVSVNGGWFDGMRGGVRITDAKLYSKLEAETINRVIMCGRGDVRRVVAGVDVTGARKDEVDAARNGELASQQCD